MSWSRALLFASALILGCSGSETSLERRGGPLPTDETGGADSGPIVPFCDALTVIRAKCQRCHQDPPKNGAPVPFLTYDDTQARYYATDMKFSDVMLPAIGNDFMPFVALNTGENPIMPPVESLTVEEKATMLSWLKQGARPEGGTECPP